MNHVRKQILLVEPDEVLAEVTSFRLELLGYQVVTVGSAEAALAHIAGHHVDLMITDVQLPQSDGATLIERLSSDEQTSDLPIIVLSVDADLDHVQSVYERGAADYLVVPFHPSVLEEKVRKHCATPRAVRSDPLESASM